jgi:hypothetical protein
VLDKNVTNKSIKDKDENIPTEKKLQGRTWWYVNKYVDPKTTIKGIEKYYGKITSSPVFFGYWARVSIYKVALRDVEENLHSLLEVRTCSCGLKLRQDQDPKSILTSPHHRNHVTLEVEPKPKFRGKVGRRISMPLQPTDWKHHVDVLWDFLIAELDNC